jgi:hypothetical protein
MLPGRRNIYIYIYIYIYTQMWCPHHALSLVLNASVLNTWTTYCIQSTLMRETIWEPSWPFFFFFLTKTGSTKPPQVHMLVNFCLTSFWLSIMRLIYDEQLAGHKHCHLTCNGTQNSNVKNEESLLILYYICKTHLFWVIQEQEPHWVSAAL